jgi:predicted  nucleic acid-binding Zn-ribbon protein
MTRLKEESGQVTVDNLALEQEKANVEVQLQDAVDTIGKLQDNISQLQEQLDDVSTQHEVWYGYNYSNML